MKISRAWAMPSHRTFSIKPIKELLSRYVVYEKDSHEWVDPFAGDSLWAGTSNDLDPATIAVAHMDALEFLRGLPSEGFNGVLFDPPYSPRQVSECYRKFDETVNMQTTQSSFWAKMKDEITRIIKPGGIVITLGWNSNGIGKSRGFEMIEILIVAHGGWHNDTIATVERKN